MDLFGALTWGNKILILLNVIYLIYLIKHLTKSMILLMVLLVGVLSLEMAIHHMANNDIPNLHLSHYYALGQFFLLSMIYYQHLNKFQLVVPIGVALFSSFLIYQLLDSQIVYNEFNTTGFLVSACTLIIYAFFYYIEHISVKRYWDSFNFGLFLYLGGSSIIFLTMNNNWKDLEVWYNDMWTINAFLTVLYQVFIAITIYRFHRLQMNQDGISSI